MGGGVYGVLFAALDLRRAALAVCMGGYGAAQRVFSGGFSDCQDEYREFYDTISAAL